LGIIIITIVMHFVLRILRRLEKEMEKKDGM